MDNQPSRNFLSEIVSLKYRLPNLKSVEIDNLLDGNKELNMFLEHCCPIKFKVLSINNDNLSEDVIKMSYSESYIDN